MVVLILDLPVNTKNKKHLYRFNLDVLFSEPGFLSDACYLNGNEGTMLKQKTPVFTFECLYVCRSESAPSELQSGKLNYTSVIIRLNCILLPIPYSNY